MDRRWCAEKYIRYDKCIISESVTNIEKDAFSCTAVNLNYPAGSFGNGQATIVAHADSYAIYYARRNGLKYEEI